MPSSTRQTQRQTNREPKGRGNDPDSTQEQQPRPPVCSEDLEQIRHEPDNILHGIKHGTLQEADLPHGCDGTPGRDGRISPP